MTKTEVFFKKHSSTILTVFGAAGVVATAVLSVKATPKALQLIEEAKEDKGQELTVVETVKIAWKPYIPAAITGISTMACIFGAHHLSAKTQASLMSAYAVLDSSYKEYREKTKELYDENADKKIEKEIVKSKFDENIVIDADKELFFDFQTSRFFESTFGEVKRAERIFNECYATAGFACLNDFYEILDNDELGPVDYGYQIGWSDLSIHELAFEYEKVEMDGGMECWIMTMPHSPSTDYVC